MPQHDGIMGLIKTLSKMSSIPVGLAKSRSSQKRHNLDLLDRHDSVAFDFY